jgi:hypothetical protein
MLVLAWPQAATAGTFVLQWDAVATAGGTLTGGSGLTLGVTLGEAVVGKTASQDKGLVENAGFWHWGSFPVLEVLPPPTFGEPGEFRLATGAPNPFSSQTLIQYSIPRSSGSTRLSLRVLDVSGRLVRSLEVDSRRPGTYAAVWDSRNEVGIRVGPGIYFVRLEGGAFRATRRLTVMR